MMKKNKESEGIIMNDFQFQNTTKVYFGKNQLHHLHEEVLKYGDKVLVAHGGEFIQNSPLYSNVLDELKSHGITVYELGAVEPNPRHTTVNRGAALCKEHGIQTTLAIGGEVQQSIVVKLLQQQHYQKQIIFGIWLKEKLNGKMPWL